MVLVPVLPLELVVVVVVVVIVVLVPVEAEVLLAPLFPPEAFTPFPESVPLEPDLETGNGGAGRGCCPLLLPELDVEVLKLEELVVVVTLGELELLETVVVVVVVVPDELPLDDTIVRVIVPGVPFELETPLIITGDDLSSVVTCLKLFLSKF